MIAIFTVPAPKHRRLGLRMASVISWTLLFAGALLLGYCAYVIADTYTYQRVESAKFDLPKLPMTSASPLSEARSPEPTYALGEVLGQMEVPRLAMRVVVVEGDSPKLLRRAAGHIPGTAFPGESGNAALAGHRDSLFRPLRNIRLGDTVAFDFRGRRLRYEVQSSQVVSPDETGVLLSTDSKELTLITCFPFSYVGPAPNRYVLRARQIAESP